MISSPLFRLCSILGSVCVVSACASAPAIDAQEPLPTFSDTPPVEETASVPAVNAKAPAFAELARCGSQLSLLRAAPLRFEGYLVESLYDLEVRVEGPAGTSVELKGPFDASIPDFGPVGLPPEVALRLPAGPATDAPAGASGALFDLGAVAAVGFTNLLLLPVSLPISLLSGRADIFLFETPSFRDGMFDDVVLDEESWKAEVARRAAPHQAALAKEAKRQARFVHWRDGLHLPEQTRTCTIDADGTACSIRLLWPTSSLRVAFSGTCAPAPAPTTTTTTPAAVEMSPPAPPPEEPRAWLPPLPAPPRPFLLESPPRPASDVRGQGAKQTLEAWSSAEPQLQNEEVHAAWGKAKPPRSAAPLASVDDATLLCRLETRSHDWDIDGSAPELRVRIAWGFDNDTVGSTFGTAAAWRLDFGLRHVSLRRGELLKISVVDVDTLVDDWGGMALLRWDGQQALRFRHANFQVECRIRPDAVAL